MKKNQPINANFIIAILVVIILGGVYAITKSDEENTEETTAVETDIKPNLNAIETIEEKQNDWYTPENYAIDFYNLINNKDWEKLSVISNNYTAEKLEDNFKLFTIKGFKVLSVQKHNKMSATVLGIVSYTNVTEELNTANVKVRLQLANDYRTWLVSPLTTY